MCSAVETTTSVAFVLVLGVNLVGGLYLADFLFKLESRHAEEWVALGKPSVTDDPVHFRGTGVLHYFFHKEYERLGDPITVNTGRKARRWLVIGIASVCGFLVFLAFVQPSTLGFACWLA